MCTGTLIFDRLWFALYRLHAEEELSSVFLERYIDCVYQLFTFKAESEPNLDGGSRHILFVFPKISAPASHGMINSHGRVCRQLKALG